jgi:hypothetical protein
MTINKGVISLVAYAAGRAAGKSREDAWDGARVEALPPPAPREFLPAYCDASNVQTGTKFARRDVKAIAADVRREIAAAAKSGALPRAKYSVRISRFANGESIAVYVDDVVGMQVENAARAEHDARNPHSPTSGLPLYSEPFAAALSAIEAMLNAHNRQNIDTSSDYFDVHFYGSVSYTGDALERAREAVRATLRP